MKPPGKPLYAVIMAGGKGTRFWPLSREQRPKHLIDVIGGKSIVERTVERIQPLIPPENILIVTAENHALELIKQLPNIPKQNIIVEPVGRNTAACIGLAAVHIAKRTSDGVMVVLPSDHLIIDEGRFRSILASAAEMASSGENLITIGIEPRGPETGYGYIEKGEFFAAVSHDAFHRVRSIREKPDLVQATSFIRMGGFFWNSGMFVWKVSTILHDLSVLLPDLARGLREIGKAIGTEGEREVIDRVYRSLEPISIDYGVMEKAKNTLMVAGDFGWSDLGSWDALWEWAEKDQMGNAVTGYGPFIGVDTRNSLIRSNGKLIALVGVEDLIVVESHDSLLICRRGASQKVKRVVETLRDEGKADYL